ncbi:MAG: hypothetical protein GX791_06215 [Synergistaceae bacterium]|nr:hypothetical protein [Synergistaceae bacterium]
MNVLIDGKKLDLPENLSSGDDILAFVKEHAGTKGRVVRGISVDGNELDEESFSALSGGNEVNFTTIPVRELVNESLNEAQNYLVNLSAGFERIADTLEGDKAGEGLGLLGSAAEGIGWLLQVLHNSQVLLGLEDGEISDGGLAELKGSLLQNIEDVSTSVEEKKYLELAYRIRNGLLPGIRRLGGYLLSMQDTSGSPLQ